MSGCSLNVEPWSHRVVSRLDVLSSHLYGGVLAPWVVGPTLFAREFLGGFGSVSRPTPAMVHEHWRMFTYKHGDDLFGKVSRAVHTGFTVAWPFVVICFVPGWVHLPQMLRFHDDQLEFEARWTGALVDAAIPIQLLVGPADPHQQLLVASAFTRVVGPDTVKVLSATVGHYPHMEAPGQVTAAIRAVVQAPVQS